MRRVLKRDRQSRPVAGRHQGEDRPGNEQQPEGQPAHRQKDQRREHVQRIRELWPAHEGRERVKRIRNERLDYVAVARLTVGEELVVHRIEPPGASPRHDHELVDHEPDGCRRRERDAHAHAQTGDEQECAQECHADRDVLAQREEEQRHQHGQPLFPRGDRVEQPEVEEHAQRQPMKIVKLRAV